MAPRILIVDDQELILSALRTVLESESRFAVCGAALNGAQAVMKAREVNPDLIILDLAMPVMNGLEAAREIASLQPTIPILLFTMTDLPQLRSEAAKVGIREVVGKSAPPGFLVGAVERALTTPGPVRADTAATPLRLPIPSPDDSGSSQAPLEFSKIDPPKTS